MTASQELKTSGPDLPGADGARPLDALLEAVGAHQDRAAFRSLFAWFAPRIKSYLMQSGSDAGQAEEVTQEVMVTIWRKAAQFDRSQASASTWVFTIARNRRIDVLRRQRRPQIDFNDPAFVPDPVARADRIFESEEDARRVRSAIEDLPDEQKTLLKMAFFDDKPHSEIAVMQGLPLGTVKSRIRLAMTRLRKRLKDE